MRGDGKRWVWQAVTLAVLVGCSYFCPPIAFFIALTLPLTTCPALADKRTAYALLLPVAPCAGFLLSGGEIGLGLCLLLPGLLCLPVVWARRRREIGFHQLTLWLIAAMLLSLLPLLARASWLVGGALFTGLAETVTEWIGTSATSGNILYSLLNLGVLEVPPEYADRAAYRIGEFVLLDPALRRELLNALRPRLAAWSEELIPSLAMQGSIIVGLFSALQTVRTRVQPMHRLTFQSLRLPKQYRGYVLFLCIGSLLLQFSASDVTRLTCTLMYAAFVTVYRLLGAATLICLLGRKNPERTALHGLLAAALYAMFPLALFLLGVADQFVNLRKDGLSHQEEEDSQ